MAATASADGALTLAGKAELFDQDMQRRFLLDGQALCKLMVPTESRTFIAYNMPDNAYMTGIYLGTLSMRYAATQDPAVKAQASRSIAALNLLCTVSGKKGLLARAAWPAEQPMADDGGWRLSDDGKYKWRGDVSSDQMDGVYYGFALAYDLVASEDERAVIAARIAEMTDHILDNGLQIIGYDGNVTTWGKYYPRYAKGIEKQNALLLLQLLKVAHHITGEARFDEAYRRYAVDEGYAEAAVKARRLKDPVRGSVNHSDDVLIFLAYYPLLTYEKDEDVRRLYLESLDRAWNGDGRFPGVKPEANPYYAFMVQRFTGDDSGTAAGIDTLRWFPLDMKWNRASIAAYEKEFGFTFDPAPKSPAPEADQPVPVDRRAKSWSAWVMDPYQPGADRNVDDTMEFNGHDYLMAYWLGRYAGYLTPDL